MVAAAGGVWAGDGGDTDNGRPCAWSARKRGAGRRKVSVLQGVQSFPGKRGTSLRGLITARCSWLFLFMLFLGKGFRSVEVREERFVCLRVPVCLCVYALVCCSDMLLIWLHAHMQCPKEHRICVGPRCSVARDAQGNIVKQGFHINCKVIECEARTCVIVGGGSGGKGMNSCWLGLTHLRSLSPPF